MYIIFAENVAKKFVKHTSTLIGVWPWENRRWGYSFKKAMPHRPLTASYAQRMRELKASDMRSVRGGFQLENDNNKIYRI